MPSIYLMVLKVTVVLELRLWVMSESFCVQTLSSGELADADCLGYGSAGQLHIKEDKENVVSRKNQKLNVEGRRRNPSGSLKLIHNSWSQCVYLPSSNSFEISEKVCDLSSDFSV